jgi:peptidoglycan/LPS O-acetylase OafA/YrhL
MINSNTQYCFRGLFAMVLFIGHYFLILDYAGMAPAVSNKFIVVLYNTCRICITGFFVSSGFYIALNLAGIKEKIGAYGFVFVKTFWIKRMLRLWPVYFVLITLAFFVLPHFELFHIDKVKTNGFESVFTQPGKIAYYFFLLPQIPYSQHYTVDFIDLTWSIGVEEIFYLFIPFVFFYGKKYLKVIAILFLSYFLFKTICFQFFGDQIGASNRVLLNISEYESILLGAMIGVLVQKYPMQADKLEFKVVLMALFCIVILLLYHDLVPYTYLHFALAFAAIFTYYYKRESVIARFKPLVFMGKISVSFYAFHEIAVVAGLNLFGKSLNVQNNIFIYLIVTFVLSVLLAIVAYKIIEEPFLLKKNALGYAKKKATMQQAQEPALQTATPSAP